MTAFGDKYGSFSFDIEKGIDPAIKSMDLLLGELEPDRWDRLREGYSDVFKNLEFSADDNKQFLFDDLVAALDLSAPAGWRFGPEEEYAVIYGFWDEDNFSPQDKIFYN